MKKYCEYKITLNTDFINKTELLSIISKIGNPVINSIKNDIYKLFFTSSEDKNRKLLFNENFEIFIKDKVICIVDFTRTNVIKLGFISYGEDDEKILEMYKKILEKYLQTKNIPYNIDEEKIIPSLFSPIERETLLNYDIEVLKTLTTDKYELIKNVAKLGTKIYKKDLHNLVNINPQLIEELVKLGFLHREYLFVCKETGRQIIQLASLDVLDSSADSLKCFYCGANLKNEIIEEIISLSNLSNEIARDNLWVASVIYRALEEGGIKEILVDSVEIGKIILLNHLSEPVVILALKEDFKIHNISLLDVYISNYRSSYIVLVTIANNARIIKDYLEKKGLKVILEDSYENLATNIKKIVDKITNIFIKDKLEAYNSYFTFKISELIEGEYSELSKVESSLN